MLCDRPSPDRTLRSVSGPQTGYSPRPPFPAWAKAENSTHNSPIKSAPSTKSDPDYDFNRFNWREFTWIYYANLRDIKSTCYSG